MSSTAARFLLATSASLAVILIVWQWSATVSAAERSVTALDLTAAVQPDPEGRLKQKRAKPPAREVKGLYLTAQSAANQAKRDEIIDLVNRTELNAVVIDIKDYSGKILYDSDLDMVERYGTESIVIKDLQSVIKKLHENGIYVIARQTVFQDPRLAERYPEVAIRNTAGGIWRDRSGLAWVDPANEEVWGCNAAIASEAIRLGFDEINFDYVRFPSDGDLSRAVFTNGARPNYEVLHDFFRFLNQKLSPKPAWISIDMFGFVMESHDGLAIGQRLSDALDEVDYISPMIYPSHYPAGYLGLKNPAAAPGTVIEHSLEKGLPHFVGRRAQARPWLQAFHLGAYYDAAKIRAQIDAVESRTTAGWLLWNAANRYSDAGLKLEPAAEN